MRIVNFETRGVPGIAADEGSGWHGLTGTPDLEARSFALQLHSVVALSRLRPRVSSPVVPAILFKSLYLPQLPVRVAACLA
jgi:hypothetical protein